MNKTGIVVVTYNRLNLLKETVEAIRKQTYRNFQIIVVNNGSTDATQEWLNKQKDIVTITQKNLGGAGGFFTGMKYVAENNYSHCWIMDDDVICMPEALSELHRALVAKENIGFVCSKVMGVNGCAMNTPEVDSRHCSNGYSDYSDLIQNEMIKVRSATFVSVLFACKTIENIGLPYREFFIWGDDTEYTMRISSLFDCYMACKSRVIHKRVIQGALSFETETDTNRLKNYFYKYRNNGFCKYKYCESSKKKIAKLIYELECLKYTIQMLLKGQFYKAKILCRVMIALPSFKPIIQYPNIHCKK